LAKPSSPTPPHRGKENLERHVDIRGPKEKIHQPVKNQVGGTAIGGYQRSNERDRKARK
jgi:hypothetical protein